MLLKWSTEDSLRVPASSYPARHVHIPSTKGSLGGNSRATNAIMTRTIPTCSVMELASSSCPTRLLSSSSTPLIKMMTDAIEMQRNKTQKLLGLEAFSSNDWDAVESLLFWWASAQETVEGVDWCWKILDRLVVECSRNSTNENDIELQAGRQRRLLGSTLPSTRGVCCYLTRNQKRQ